LPEPQVLEAQQRQWAESARDRGLAPEHLERALDGHIEHVGDRDTVAFDGQHLVLEAPAAARGADQPHVGQKLHLDGLRAFAGAGLAAAALDVERERCGSEPARAGRRFLRVQRADRVPGFGIGGGVAARGAPERALIDQANAA
jgi:hypothetical protein